MFQLGLVFEYLGDFDSSLRHLRAAAKLQPEDADIWGAIAATMQTDLKRLVAYSSVAHLGFIVLGTFALTSQAIAGGVMQNINHGISTGALFILVGVVIEFNAEHRRPVVVATDEEADVLLTDLVKAGAVLMLEDIGERGLH